MFVKLQPRRSLDSFAGLTPTPCPLSPNSHGIISFADPHPLTSIELHPCKNLGGTGHLPLSDPYPLVPTTYPPSFHTLAHSFALFCTHARLNSFVFKRFRTLRQKINRGGGTVQRSFHPSTIEPALPPMVKWRSPLSMALTKHGVRRLAAAFFRLAADDFCRGAASLRPSLAR